MRTLALLAVIAGLAAGCSLGSSGSHTPAPPGILAPPLSHYRGNGIAFSYPAAWGHHRHGFYSMETDGIIDLSTQRMVDPCRPAGNGHTCGWPLRTLHPGGVVVTWTTGGDIDPAARPTAGKTVKVTRPGDCRSIGGGETLLARIVTSRRSVFSVAACLRAPGVAANEREFRAMLTSARGISPPVALTTFHGGGVSFRYPAAWSHHRPGVLSNLNSGIVDLSTQPMVNPCRSHGSGYVCDWPLDRLRPGGVLVAWSHDDALVSPPPQSSTGSAAEITRPGFCGAIGADETFTARIVTHKRRAFSIRACMRGSDIPADVREVQAMLVSAR